MTAETDLLPLPEPVAVKYPDSGLRDDEHALRLWVAHGYDTGGEPLFSAEQLREAVAPLQAEVEALRAESAEAAKVLRGALDARTDGEPLRVLANRASNALYWRTESAGRAKARAERLAEALRNSADALERLAFAIRAPNAHTPQLVELAIAMRAAAQPGGSDNVR